MGLKRAQNGLKTSSKRVQTQILLTSIRVELSATKGCLKAEKINTLYYYFFCRRVVNTFAWIDTKMIKHQKNISQHALSQRRLFINENNEKQ